MGDIPEPRLKTGYGRKVALGVALFLLGVVVSAGLGRAMFADDPYWTPVRTAASKERHTEGEKAGGAEAAEFADDAAQRLADEATAGIASIKETKRNIDEVTETAREVKRFADEVGAVADTIADAGAGDATDTDAPDAASTDDDRLSEDEQVKEAADAAVSFWKLAWRKSWPFIRFLGVGVWELVADAWENVAGMITIEPIEPPADAATSGDGA